MPLTEQEKKMAARTEKTRRQSEEKKQELLRFEEEWASYKRRRDRQNHLKSDEAKEKEKKGAVFRAGLMKMRESVIDKYFS